MEPKFSETNTAVTEGIRVSVRSAYLKDESSPAHDHFVFAYEVEIRNESPYRVQLLRRHWDITDGYGRRRSVNGDGVVGKTPVLLPGEMHRYVSGCSFNTPVGRMYGHYDFVRGADGKSFYANIPPFIMAVPALLN